MKKEEPGRSPIDERVEIRRRLQVGSPKWQSSVLVLLSVLLAAIGLGANYIRGTQRMTEESVLALIAASPRNGVGPVGSVIAWPASEPSVPNGWHVCDGSDLKADEYPELTRILGATYGAVGPNQVRLPDFRGYFLRGRDKSPGQDQGSLELGQPEDWATALPTGSGHVPIFSGINSEKMFTKMGYLQFKSGEGSVVGGIIASEKDASEVQNWQHSHPLSGGDKETRPKNYAVHWLIRVR